MRTSITHPLRVDTVASGPAAGLLGLTFCPGKQGDSVHGAPWARSLEADMTAIAEWGASAVVTLIEDHEFSLLGVSGLGEAVRRHGMQWFHMPIVDVQSPDERFERAWQQHGGKLLQMLGRGQRVLVHCRGGLGRAGLVGARILVELGQTPDAAIALIRQTRPGAIETAGQERYVRQLGLFGKGNLGPRLPKELPAIHQPLVDSLVDSAHSGLKRRHSIKRLCAWIEDHDWDLLVDDGPAGCWVGLAIDLRDEASGLSDNNLLEESDRESSWSPTDDDRISYARRKLAGLFEQLEDSVLTVHAYPLKHTNGTAALLCGTARMNGQGGPEIDWHMEFSSMGAYQDWLLSRSVLPQERILDLTDAQILAVWRRKGRRS